MDDQISEVPKEDEWDKRNRLRCGRGCAVLSLAVRLLLIRAAGGREERKALLQCVTSLH